MNTTLLLVIIAGFLAVLYGIVQAVALLKKYSDELARKTFRFSLIHLTALFAVLLLDHYILT